MIKETHRWPIKSFAFNQVHAQDGAIFPWLCDFPDCVIRARTIFLVLEKFTRAYSFQIALEIMWLPVLKKKLYNEIAAVGRWKAKMWYQKCW